MLAPYWRDQRTDAVGGCTGCGIFTTTTGTAPNRVFRAEYRTIYFGQTSATPTLDYEVNLYESGTPAFDFTYGLVTTFSATGRFLTVGVQKDTTLFTEFGCDPTGGTSPPVSHRSATDRHTPVVRNADSNTYANNNRDGYTQLHTRLVCGRAPPNPRRALCWRLFPGQRKVLCDGRPQCRHGGQRFHCTHLNMIRRLTLGQPRQLPTPTTRSTTWLAPC